MKKGFEFRASTLKERKEFYEKEFDINKVKAFFNENKIPIPQICALDAGSDSGIIENKEWNNNLFYLEFKDLAKKIKKYNPEDVYYDRSVYENPKKVLDELKFEGYLLQELAFDIDADNISDVSPEDREEYEKVIYKAYDYALKLKKELEKEFERVIIVYSGRGFHIEVLDEKANKLNNEERGALAEKFSKYPIDPWVSRGYIRLLRIPYTLNAVVSRISLPITNIFNSKETIPDFLKNS
jgi:DNA primase small subunit